LQTLKQKSAEAGFDLKARLPIYPEFIAQAEKFLPPSLFSYVERLGDAGGLVKGGGPLGSMPSIHCSDSSAI
jgi:FO synthase